MTNYTPAGQEMADQLLVGQGNRKSLGVERLCNELGEFRARVEALEGKYETMRLATLEWGKDVENLQRWNDQHLMRIERLEGTRDPASKVYKINEPLKLTPRQQEEIAALLRPNSKPAPNPSQIGSSLVERVAEHLTTGSHEEARAAIHEVAAWFGDKATPGTPQWIAAADLTEEVER